MIDRQQLIALAAIVETGSFEAAAARLNLTQSAISQRIRALEDRLGGPVLVRSQPCRPTKSGARLVRHGQDVALLEDAALRDIGFAPSGDDRLKVRLALNADSLATWMMPALSAVSNILFDIVIDDEDYAAAWLRKGEVVAAITSRAEPVQGCDVKPLGALDYMATASPAFAQRYFPDGLSEEAFRRAPSLAFNTKDALQNRFVEREIGRRVPLPVHWIASTEGFVEATRLGLGWGLNPTVLAMPLVERGDLQVLSEQSFQTPLYWQVSRLVAEPLVGLTQAMMQAAEGSLVQIR